MNDGKEWQHALPEFLLEAQRLLTKSEECLNHLHLIRNDSDAIDCMKTNLILLAERAEPLALRAISEFSRHVHDLIRNAADPIELHDQALDALHACLTLLAWQLELIDIKTGELRLDDSEQVTLIETVTHLIPQQNLGYQSPQHFPYAS